MESGTDQHWPKCTHYSSEHWVILTLSGTTQTSVYESQPATELVKEKLRIRTDSAFAAHTWEAPAELRPLLFLYA